MTIRPVTFLMLPLCFFSNHAVAQNTCAGADCAIGAAAELGFVAVNSVLGSPKTPPGIPKLTLSCQIELENKTEEPCDLVKVEVVSADKSFAKTALLQGGSLLLDVSAGSASYSITARRQKCPFVQRQLTLPSNGKGAVEFFESDCRKP